MLKERGPRRVSPFFIPGRLINLASGYVSIAHGLKGPNHAVVTACSTGAHAIGDAARLVALGDADVMVAGGAESPISRIGDGGLRRLPGAVDGVQRHAGARVAALRPRSRRLRHGRGRRRRRARGPTSTPRARGAKIYAELIGYGMSGDAYHITAPAEDGDGALRCMNAAIKRAGIAPAEIDYINAHGTSTPLGDEIELGAVQRLVGNAAGTHVHVLDQIVDRASARARPARSRRSSRSWRCATAWRRRRSISTTRRSRRRSTSCRIARRSATSTSCCPIRSDSAAPTRRWYFGVSRISATVGAPEPRSGVRIRLCQPHPHLDLFHS